MYRGTLEVETRKGSRLASKESNKKWETCGVMHVDDDRGLIGGEGETGNGKRKNGHNQTQLQTSLGHSECFQRICLLCSVLCRTVYSVCMSVRYSHAETVCSCSWQLVLNTHLYILFVFVLLQTIVQLGARSLVLSEKSKSPDQLGHCLCSFFLSLVLSLHVSRSVSPAASGLSARPPSQLPCPGLTAFPLCRCRRSAVVFPVQALKLNVHSSIVSVLVCCALLSCFTISSIF